MSIMQDEICKCICHEPGAKIRHIRACCYTCSQCNQSIKFDFWNKHKENCKALNEEGRAKK